MDKWNRKRWLGSKLFYDAQTICLYNNFQFYQDVEGIHVEELAIPGSSVHVVRATGILKGVDLEAMLTSFSSGGLKERQKVNTEIIVRCLVVIYRC